ncbi:hypothetical protein AMS68_002762 [Peltaster fructicola]|uniref:CHRD domain-containing protein n=1 Tax=Peltaster fructicola TaxID=286661 RepID=A0A6H0XRI6_9PEZI|nr:hypothetical protein AMS68_002762 [Peltaster fructicola]
MKITIVAASALAYASIATAVPAAVNAEVQPYELDPRSAGWSNKWWSRKRPQKDIFDFTSTYYVTATPDQVIATNQTAVPGQAGAVGYYYFGINSHLDTICYNITLVGIQGNYQSPAKTATHIHEAACGRAGPPRLAFPNPVADANNANIRRSAGCLTGPFTTGIQVNNTAGTDTGNGFKVAQIEANPAGFFADVHTAGNTQGAVRGQLA